MTTAHLSGAQLSAAQLLEPSIIARLLASALEVLHELATTSKDPIQRRLAATTIIKTLTAKPPASRAPRPETPTPRAQVPTQPRSSGDPTQPALTSDTCSHRTAPTSTPKNATPAPETSTPAPSPNWSRSSPLKTVTSSPP
ncbi:MAG TPA: hypothetical protein VHN77_13600 [Phycisphaerales bacterium]|nr:hypothetical protein [Phycisphaerales bacterium]